jgi:hypothetical protein
VVLLPMIDAPGAMYCIRLILDVYNVCGGSVYAILTHVYAILTGSTLYMILEPSVILGGGSTSQVTARQICIQGWTSHLHI